MILKKLFNKIRNLFLIDESLVKSFVGEWEIISMFQTTQESRYCVFNIFYSEKKSRVTIYYSGFQPLFHEVYSEDVVPFVQDFIKLKEKKISVSIKNFKHV